jgi:hypothetical protein
MALQIVGNKFNLDNNLTYVGSQFKEDYYENQKDM